MATNLDLVGLMRHLIATSSLIVGPIRPCEFSLSSVWVLLQNLRVAYQLPKAASLRRETTTTTFRRWPCAL